MKNLFNPAMADVVRARITRLKPESERQWGKMNPAQVLAHCSGALEYAVGDKLPPRMFLGRIIGGMVKKKVLGNDEPLGRNSPTAKDLVIQDQRNFESERNRLCGLIDRFTAGGPAGCTAHPHTFFGPLTPDEWAILMYKHLDHHLRQFGV